MKNPGQPSQPPKESVYLQPLNPITHSPYEQRIQPVPAPHAHQHNGNPVSSVSRRTYDSRPSSDESIAGIRLRHEHQLKEMQSDDLDTEYGVEQQPNEGDIAHAVEGHSRHVQVDACACACAGTPALGEEPDLMANMERKRREHYRVLGERAERRQPVPDGETAEREALRLRRLKQDRELHVQDVVHEATGDPVVG
ncbi:hypothetical protein P175DRAFT_0502178 [Aspergillus ochraceoroseus IBT 24754]|uniref:Uncharacterized protein n=2 Tax=Aspergillus ochraceoroseus TaxID=138278 RepID=A0A2T5LUR9_9EURO|nr:uncharacterized protein P175DRAFT_0502178 [Aspergillus ochraceoroseus IBT 24754]KKK16057.1 hypothetical protein AOCH_005915 [Aspergillus ochraceoroseus]PTU20026.1 hypothetical protein P175DRAFT_0502178 [Aspergillus ochraceoroseus IBT 24754]